MKGDFYFVEDRLHRELYCGAYNAVSDLDLWPFLSSGKKQGRPKKQRQLLKRLHAVAEQIENGTPTIHAPHMLQIVELIALKGWDDWKTEYIKQHRPDMIRAAGVISSRLSAVVNKTAVPVGCRPSKDDLCANTGGKTSLNLVTGYGEGSLSSTEYATSLEGWFPVKDGCTPERATSLRITPPDREKVDVDNGVDRPRCNSSPLYGSPLSADGERLLRLAVNLESELEASPRVSKAARDTAVSIPSGASSPVSLSALESLEGAAEEAAEEAAKQLLEAVELPSASEEEEQTCQLWLKQLSLLKESQMTMMSQMGAVAQFVKAYEQKKVLAASRTRKTLIGITTASSMCVAAALTTVLRLTGQQQQI